MRCIEAAAVQLAPLLLLLPLLPRQLYRTRSQILLFPLHSSPPAIRKRTWHLPILMQRSHSGIRARTSSSMQRPWTTTTARNHTSRRHADGSSSINNLEPRPRRRAA